MANNGDVSSTKKVSKPKKKVVRSVITREDRVLEKLLIENFISMQKVMSALTFKFDNLSKQIEGLLTLFEDSAKAVAEKEINLELKGDTKKQEEVLEKLKLLLDQNKLIAKGITLVHENSNSTKESPHAIESQIKPQGFRINPTTIEDMRPSENLSTSNTFSQSKDTQQKSVPNTREQEGPPIRPSFSI